MKSVVASVTLVIGMLGVSGCTNDSGTTNPAVPAATAPSLVGVWTVVSAPAPIKHLEFTSDNVYYMMNQFAYGLRAYTSGVYQVSGNAIDFGSSQSPSLYAFTIKNDTLSLVSPPQAAIIAFRNPAAPADTAWVRSAVILDSIAAPIQETTDITLNGNALWYGNAYSSHTLYKIDLVSRSVDTLQTNQYAWAVEWDGSNLWCSSDGSDQIYKLNAAGATIGTSASMGSWIEGIAWDGTVFWAGSWNERSLYRYNPVSNTVLSTLYVGWPVEGLAAAGGFMYACVRGVINKCSTTPFTTVASYRIGNAYAAGIAFDGINFWVACRLGSGEGPGVYRIYKVALP
jgi:hypothetical protein